MTAINLNIGDKCPPFRLKAIDNNYYSNESFHDEKTLIIIFSCNHCPYVQAYEDRIKSVQSDYSKLGVRIIAINSNDSSQYEDDSFEGMIERAKNKTFNFLYLRDEDQNTAILFGATHTPEVFVFNSQRMLVYKGKIDDNWKDEKNVINHYLREALDELLEGKEISVPETFSIGCTIKWKPEKLKL